MPTAIRDVESRRLPDGFDGLEGYDRVLVLVRRDARPVAQCTLPVLDGRVSGAALRRAVEEHGSQAIWWADCEAELAFSGRDAGALPARMTVAVCTRDRADDLERCLVALEAMPDDGQELVVVDSASVKPATREVVARHPRVRYLREELAGADRARNRALRDARGDVVAFTDDDAVVDPGWLRALRANFGDPRTMCVTGLTLPLELETPAQEWFERSNQFGRGYERRVFDGLVHDPFLVAAAGASVNAAVRRTITEHVGVFDESLDGGTPAKSGGDHDLFSRILLAGYRIVYEPSALVWHRHRREWGELRSTLFGYGCGVYAHLTAALLRGEPGAIRPAVGWLRSQVPGLARSFLRRPGAVPLDLALAELRGCARGPFALMESRRQLRRRGAAR